ncbi:hypothetical protein KKF91_06135 [Myxococcota bacterium]|nr:hypothetical protein [Myxococcota bacterium]MBU1430131.1 hypothetical protein [Myxococcota bacterium]MBU1896902.1 hypothetical protein [Myxococcota bacterium]
MIPPLSGPAVALFEALRRADLFLLLWLLATALILATLPSAGLEGLLLLPAALLPLSLLAREVHARRLPLGALAWALGLGVALWASTTPLSAQLRLMPGAQLEHLTDAQGLRHHLGGPLRASWTSDRLILSLGLGRQAARLSLPAQGGEGALGRWRVRLDGQEAPSGPPTHARLSVGLKDRPDAWETITLGLNAQVVVEGVVLTLEALDGDYEGELGPAARLRLKWAGREDSAWRFQRAATLDARYSEAPLGVILLGVEAARPALITLYRPPEPLQSGALALGWGLMALGLALSWRRA